MGTVRPSAAFEVPGLVRLAGLALRRPLPVLALYALLSAGALLGLLRLELRTDGASLYPTGDAMVERTLADRAAFHEAEQILLLVTAKEGGPAVASPEGFRFLARLQKHLEKLPGLEPRGVRSLVTLIEPPEDIKNFRIRTFFETWDGTPAGFPDVLARIRRLPLATGLFLAADGREAAFTLSLAHWAERREVLADLEGFAASRAGGPFRLRVTGPAAAEVALGDEVLRDLSRLVPLTVLAFAVLLWIGLRSAGGVLLPMVQVASTLVWTLGIMGWAGVPVTLVTTILPVVLLALSMTDEVHLLERIRDRLGEESGPDRVRQASLAAFADLAAPLALSSLINAAGFLSFLTASLAPLRDFGLFSSLGILLAMAFTFTLVPALIAVLPARFIERRTRGAAAERPAVLGLFFARHARASALTGAALLVLAIPGLFRLRVQDSWVENFTPGSSLVQAELAFNRAFWGSYRFDVVLAGEPGFFWTPAGVALLEEVHGTLERAPHVGGVLSVLPAFEAAAEARGSRPPVSRLAQDEVQKVGALTEILRIRLDLAHILTQDGGTVRLRAFVRNADSDRALAIEDFLHRELPPRVAQAPGVSLHWSGDVPVSLRVVDSIVGNQLRSLGGSAALIGLMLLIALRSLRLSAIVLVPVLATNLLLFAVLGYAGIPLGIATSMFAALTLGAGIDFALHYVAAYRRERRGRDHAGAIAATLRTAGRGLRWNATVLAFGFAVLALSALRPNSSLGLLLGAAMLVSYATTLLFLPERLRFGEEKGRSPEAAAR